MSRRWEPLWKSFHQSGRDCNTLQCGELIAFVAQGVGESHRRRVCEGVCVTAGWVLMNHFLKIVFSAGDVSPISMSPISQSQFIPLGEILCLAISAMNSARKPVTQEALMEHLTTCFPGKRRKNKALSKRTCVLVVLGLHMDSYKYNRKTLLAKTDQ